MGITVEVTDKNNKYFKESHTSTSTLHDDLEAHCLKCCGINKADLITNALGELIVRDTSLVVKIITDKL